MIVRLNISSGILMLTYGQLSFMPLSFRQLLCMAWRCCLGGSGGGLVGETRKKHENTIFLRLRYPGIVCLHCRRMGTK